MRRSRRGVAALTAAVVAVGSVAFTSRAEALSDHTRLLDGQDRPGGYLGEPDVGSHSTYGPLIWKWFRIALAMSAPSVPAGNALMFRQASQRSSSLDE
jgi:hypothetical protein